MKKACYLSQGERARKSKTLYIMNTSGASQISKSRDKRQIATYKKERKIINHSIKS
uniref:Uncharacterized protein n=1 Tax=Arundo donax TaxID=35708 RepID=A0A0A8ZVR0_ARUDO